MARISGEVLFETTAGLSEPAAKELSEVA